MTACDDDPKNGWESALLSERMLAARWGVSGRTLQRWRNGDHGPPWIRIGGSIRYSIEDILAFEAKMRRGRKP